MPVSHPKFTARGLVIWGGTDFQPAVGFVNGTGNTRLCLYKSLELGRWIIVKGGVTPFKLYIDGEEAKREHSAYNGHQVWTSATHTLICWTPPADMGSPQAIVLTFAERQYATLDNYGQISLMYKYTHTYTPIGGTATTLISAPQLSYSDATLLPRFSWVTPGAYAFIGVDDPSRSIAVELKYGDVWSLASGGGPLGKYTKEGAASDVIELNEMTVALSTTYCGGNMGVLP